MASAQLGLVLLQDGRQFPIAFRVWPHGDRRLYRLGIKVDYGGMDERYAMNKTIASRPNDPCSVIAALR